MKNKNYKTVKVSLFLLLTFTFSLSTVIAQAPNAIKYQAVARDASGDVIANESVSLTISILQGSVTGTEVFTETHDSTTNAYGLVSLNIGAGNPTDFANIDWANGPYFVKVVMGGNVMGTSQLLSVPYAKYADNAGNVLALDNTTAFTPDADYEPATKKYVDDNVGGSGHYVGELYGGGIVFYVYDNGQHGLIASLDDLDGGSGVAWSATTGTEIGASAKSFYDGASNTAAIVAQDGTAGYAATLCNSYTGGGQTDWYLPASWELNLLYNSAFLINKILENDGDGTTNGFNAQDESPTYGGYWSSTENDSVYAWYYYFLDGHSGNYVKTSTYRVRAVRAF
jgi:hypothetical protein